LAPSHKPGPYTAGVTTANRDIGVCSWSLCPSGPDDLVGKVRACGLSVVQLALDPIREARWDESRTRQLLWDAGIAVASGMMAMAGEDYSSLESIRETGGVRSDRHWRANLDAARRNADLTHRLGITLVTFHAGFLPHDESDPLRALMLERLGAIADVFGAAGVRVGFETGQETAGTLLDVLDDLDRANVGVNFDPANMILYGMGDPVEALRELADHVMQLHIKDAVPSRQPGSWGTETPAGRGAVNWDRCFALIREMPPAVGLMIEREGGQNRIEDIRAARDLVRRCLGDDSPS